MRAYACSSFSVENTFVFGTGFFLVGYFVRLRGATQRSSRWQSSLQGPIKGTAHCNQGSAGVNGGYSPIRVDRIHHQESTKVGHARNPSFTPRAPGRFAATNLESACRSETRPTQDQP